MDAMVMWAAVGGIGSVAAASVAAGAAWLSRSSAREANAAAAALAGIERDRRHAELTPRFRVSTESQQPVPPQGYRPGAYNLRLRVMLLGPPGLDHLDSVTVRIRDDHFRRGDGQLLAGGPTREQIQAQIWGPWRFSAGTGPDEARPDRAGRVIEYGERLPVGEELPFLLDPTMRPPWATSTTPEGWAQERGTVLRLAIDARHAEHGSWTLPCEIDTVGGQLVVVVIP
jgi:hypothetical protein